jgi:hypothetical protein
MSAAKKPFPQLRRNPENHDMGRELRMIEPKREVNELCRRLGEPPRYGVDAPPAGKLPSAGPDLAPPSGGGP